MKAKVETMVVEFLLAQIILFVSIQSTTDRFTV